MNKLANISLAKKLTILTIGICLGAVSAILLLVYSSLLSMSEAILSNELTSHKYIIARAYSEPLWTFDRVQIQEVSHSFFKYNGYASILALKVVDSNGKVLFDKSHDPEHLYFDQLKNRPFTQVSVHTIEKNGESLGTVSIAFTTDGFISSLRSKLATIFIVSFLILVVMSAWFLFFFDHLLTNPFNNLLEHIKHIRNQDYESKDYSPLPYEMRLISNALNYTSHLIRKRNEELKNQRENLEKIVAQRTDELKGQIEKNTNASRLVAVGEVASGIAHEINNPLTVINGQVSKIKRLSQGSAQECELLQSVSKIQKMSERIVKIINGLKLISRDGTSDAMADFSLFQLVDDIRLLTEMKIKAQNIELHINIDPNLSLAFGREVQISQVIVNLINNSVDAISTLSEKWINITVRENGDMIEFSITDSGNGIPSMIRDKIMQPFFTTKDVGKGTGLGLSISKGIILDHGGQFYYNENAANTQFIFMIKKAQAKALAA